MAMYLETKRLKALLGRKRDGERLTVIPYLEGRVICYSAGSLTRGWLVADFPVSDLDAEKLRKVVSIADDFVIFEFNHDRQQVIANGIVVGSIKETLSPQEGIFREVKWLAYLPISGLLELARYASIMAGEIGEDKVLIGVRKGQLVVAPFCQQGLFAAEVDGYEVGE